MSSSVSRIFRAAVALLVLFLVASAHADDASCYAAGKAQCDKSMDFIHNNYAYGVLDSCTFGQSDATTWVAIVKYHYGSSAPGSPGTDTPTFVCNAGETPQPPPDAAVALS